jgi:hypothetical protein
MSKVFTLAAPLEEDQMEPAEPRWRKNAPPSRVLFATNGRRAVSVIDHVGPDAAYLLSGDFDGFVDSDLRPWKFPGIWVWEGQVRSYRSYEGEYDEEVIGDIRPLNEDEENALQTDDDPWDYSLWKEPTKA